MITEYLRGGYRVFYLELDGTIVGHIVMARGGRRLKNEQKSDIILGPIFISPSFRGKGLERLVYKSF